MRDIYIGESNLPNEVGDDLEFTVGNHQQGELKATCPYYFIRPRMKALSVSRASDFGLKFNADLRFLSPFYATRSYGLVIENKLEEFGDPECTRNP